MRDQAFTQPRNKSLLDQAWQCDTSLARCVLLGFPFPESSWLWLMRAQMVWRSR